MWMRQALNDILEYAGINSLIQTADMDTIMYSEMWDKHTEVYTVQNICIVLVTANTQIPLCLQYL